MSCLSLDGRTEFERLLLWRRALLKSLSWSRSCLFKIWISAFCLAKASSFSLSWCLRSLISSLLSERHAKNIFNQWENGNRSTQSEVSLVSNRPIRGQRYAKFNSRKFFYAYLRVEKNRVPVLISSFGLVPTDLNSFYLLNTYPFQMTHNYVWA